MGEEDDGEGIGDEFDDSEVPRLGVSLGTIRSCEERSAG